jgi:serine/threonine-protein kinase
MSLAAGTRLGPYEIEALIGAGGMGEVYKARDTRLGRTVAIKILPHEVAADPERRRRFEREARAVSALNHPHICTLYDIGSTSSPQAAGGANVDYLVMEYLEGESLAHRLLKGPIPLTQALEYGIQIADALTKAHRQGIVHRDLKPGNVMITKSGAKLLDFGLAKLKLPQSVAASDATSALPTQESVTATGTVPGTVPYLAPEQLEGKDADARSDLFAFGAVLYEMLTGRRAFEGASPAIVIAAILEHDPPPLSSLQHSVPPALEWLVKRCLAKDPDERWDSAHDIAAELQWIARTPSVAATSRPSRWPRRIVIFAAGLGGVALGVALTLPLAHRPAAPAGTVLRAQVTIRPAGEFGGRNRLPRAVRTARSAGGGRTALALSPDGRQLVFVARNGDLQQLYSRALDGDRAAPLAGTLGAEVPFFSPDGRWIGFWADGQLRKIPAQGGPATAICDVAEPSPFGASWGDAGDIVFAMQRDGRIWRVPANGGTPQPLTVLAEGEFEHRLPQMLPGGRGLLFTVRRDYYGWSRADVCVQPAGSRSHRVVVSRAADARYVDTGHLVFMRLGTLAAVPFDPDRLEVAGNQAGLIDNVAQAINNVHGSLDSGAGQFSVSRSGTLAYVTGGVPQPLTSRLATMDRDGTIHPLPIEPRSYGAPVRLSPDGRRLATIVVETMRRDVWICDLSRATAYRLTTDAEAHFPLWSPDGRFVTFSSATRGRFTIARTAADGSGDSETLGTGNDRRQPSSWSPDGRTLLCVIVPVGRTDNDVWALSGTRPPFSMTPVIGTPFSEDHPEFSPDGHCLAYQSNTTGRMEVYLQRYPGPPQSVVVSSGGGTDPAWNPNGRELFYLSPDEAGVTWMTAVAIRTEPAIAAGTPRRLFAVKGASMAGDPIRQYDVAPDGQHFVLRLPEESPPPVPVTEIELVQNWFEELRAKVPARRQPDR